MSASRPFVFGEVLFDRFPDGSRVLGGAPFNVAWHLAAFGARPVFVSRVGADDAGAEVRDAMAAWGMEDDWVQTDPGHPTGAVEVTLDGGSPAFTILPDQAYDFVDGEEIPGELAGAALLYHGTLALRSAGSRRALEHLRRRTAAPVFLDVNLRDPWWDRAPVEEWIRRAKWVKLNDGELGALGGESEATADAAERFRWRFGLDAVLLTRGSRGSLYCAAGDPPHEVMPARDVPVVDTVGAGDAFTAVTLLGLLSGWEMARTQRRAQEFASAVVGLRGATCRDREFYEPFLAGWREGGKGK